nr:T9SS type A sorting domain-containing protein [Bacteroidota bacterium]
MWQKGKGHTIIQKSGSNDPINFYIKDSITGKDTLGTLLSIHFSFYTGLDTLSQLNYWRSDTVHIESDSSEFKIIYPSNLTSLNGSLIINVNGCMVSSIVKTGNYSTFNQVLVGQFLPLHFYLNDSLHFHYNLDSMQLLNTMGITNQDSLHVRLFMFGNCENNYAMDTTLINLVPVVVNATCANVANGVISVTATLGHAPYTYAWSNGATTATATGLAEGTYTVIVTDVTGCTASSVNIITAPNALTATCTSTNVTCNIANNGTASVSSSGGSGNSSYSWSNGSTGTFVSGLSQGTYTVTVTDANGCTNTCTSVITSTGTTPAPPGLITGTTALCRNTIGNTFSILPVAGATSYTWTLGAGAIITQGQGGTVITFSLTGSALPGMVSVTASNVCGTSTSSNLNYTVNSIPGAPSTILGQTSGVCNKPNVPYSTATVSSATSYFWTVPTGSSIVSGQGSNAVVVSFSNSFTGTGNITVKAVNTCGMSAARTLALNAKPQSPIISGLNYACKNQPGLHYTVLPVAGATSYTWTVVPGSTIVSGQSTPHIVVNWGNINGLISCKANNNCGSSVASNLAVAFTCKNENETIDPNSISLYPNPGKGRITLQYESYTDGEMEMSLYELTCKIIFNKKLVSAYGNNKHEIDFANLSSGIYLVQLKVDGTNKWMKLIIND